MFWIVCGVTPPGEQVREAAMVSVSIRDPCREAGKGESGHTVHVFREWGYTLPSQFHSLG